MFLSFPFLFVVISSGILIIIWASTGKIFYGKVPGMFWGSLILLISLSLIISALKAKKKLIRNDFNGTYIIDNSYFPGKQADWQYNSFRFEIKANDSIYFHITETGKIIKTFTGKVSTSKGYNSERISYKMELPAYHILETDPTIYRSAWSFYLVFNSRKFGNMYFKKGSWKPLK